MSSSPTFPQELFDLIIDETSTFNPEADRTHQLATLALVCKAFCDRAHRHLFASVKIVSRKSDGKPNRLKRVRQLYKLLKVETSALASWITSFTYTFWHARDSKSEVAFILRKLFNDYYENVQTHRLLTPCFLSLEITARWLALGTDLGSALFEVCHRQRLASLTVSHLQHMPSNFFMHSYIKNLALHQISWSEPLPKVSFEKIVKSREKENTSNISPSHGASSHVEMSPFIGLPNMKNLVFELNYGTAEVTVLQEILLTASASLEFLDVRVGLSATSGINPIPFNKLRRLRTLTIGQCAVLSGLSSTHRFLLEGTDFCPSLEKVEVHFILRTDDLMAPAVPISHHSIAEYTAFDDLFSQPQFSQIQFLTFHVCSGGLNTWRLPDPELE
ncbi:hypothetical protein CPC08DRAFT_748905 [Agrocybe pediades]|nr:hypothetical protein CPC08DRAFT_748905 [Agrocybe pediades]